MHRLGDSPSANATAARRLKRRQRAYTFHQRLLRDYVGALMPERGLVVLQIASLTKFYGEQLALEDVGFSLQAREILGLIGPNGAAIAGNSKATMLTTAINSTLVPIFMSTSLRNVRLLDGKRRLRHHAKTIRMGSTPTSNVVLPAPFGPIRPRISRACSEKPTSSSASCSP